MYQTRFFHIGPRALPPSVSTSLDMEFGGDSEGLIIKFAFRYECS